MAGLPGLVAPAGLSAEGLPLGLQLIGRPFDEETLFALGEAIEQSAGALTPARGVVGLTTPHGFCDRKFETRDMSATAANSKLIKGATGDWEVVIGLEVHAQVTSQAKLFSGASTDFGGAPEHACVAGRRGDAGHAAGHQRECVAPGGAHRPRPQGADQSALDLRPQELLLSRPAAGLSDLAVQEPDRRRRRDPGRSHARPFDHGRHRAAASRAGRRQVAARPVADDELRRSQPLRRRADGDRLASPTCARPTRPRPM